MRRNRPAFAVASAVGLLLVAGIFFSVRDAVRTRGAANVERNLRTKAEQARIEAEALNCGEGGPQLWDAIELRPVGRLAPIQNISGVSPDARFLFDFASDRAFRAWEVSGGNKVWEITLPQHPGLVMSLDMAVHPQPDQRAARCTATRRF